MKSLFLLMIVIFLSSPSLCDLRKENVVLAINCGGDEYRDHNGIFYQKDNYYQGGQTSDFGTNFQIKLTKDGELYQTERWSSEDLEYDIPLSLDGHYVLNLKFSEVYFNSPGEKIFDVMIGTETIFKQLDIFAKVGKATALDEYIEFELRNNKIIINGKGIANGYDQHNQHVKLVLKKGEKDNPKINGLVLIKGTIDDTDYSDFKNQMEEFEREKIEKERKQREFQKVSKSIDFEDFEDDFVDDGKSFTQNNPLFSKEALLVAGFIGIISYFLFFTKGKKNDDE